MAADGNGTTNDGRGDDGTAKALSKAAVARRTVLSGAGVWALAACSTSSKSDGSGKGVKAGSSAKASASSASPQGKTIGDGSMSDTGPQPGLYKPKKLKKGDVPPQFVVVSWDGAAELVDNPLLSRFRKVSRETGAHMTLFLSGIYFLPESKKTLYHAPHHKPGATDINFLPDDCVHATIKGIGESWTEGHEIGTHFNGHFCGPTGGSTWSPSDWGSEIEQARSFVANWRTNTGSHDLPPLPFDYDKELIGGRTPCLEGGDNLRTEASKLGWRYDTSKSTLQMWPKKDKGLWDMSLQSIPLAGTRFQVLSMDYNIMFNQSKVTKGNPAMHATWRKQAVDSYMAGFNRSYEGNRAPLVIGNHFEGWNGGIYMDAVEEVMRKVAAHKDAKMVSFRELCDWMDAQDPKVVKKLQALAPGETPPGGWDEYLELT